MKEELKDSCKLPMLAAFVDGEGTIGVSKNKKKSGNYSYSQHLQVSNTDVRLMNWLVDNFGGPQPQLYKEKQENHRDSYKWVVGGYKSYKLIKSIRPYLLLKYQQADLAIELWDKISKFGYKGSYSVPPYKRRLGEELYQLCKKLNKRGRDKEDIDIVISIKKELLDKWLE